MLGRVTGQGSLAVFCRSPSQTRRRIVLRPGSVATPWHPDSKSDGGTTTGSRAAPGPGRSMVTLWYDLLFVNLANRV